MIKMKQFFCLTLIIALYANSVICEELTSSVVDEYAINNYDVSVMEIIINIHNFFFFVITNYILRSYIASMLTKYLI